MRYLFALVSCRKDLVISTPATPPPGLAGGPNYPISVGEAMAHFAQAQARLLESARQNGAFVEIEPLWNEASEGQSLSGRQFIIVPLADTSLQTLNQGRAGAKLLFNKNGADTSVEAQVLLYVADSAYYAAKNQTPAMADFTGSITFYDLAQNFQYGIYLQNGAPIALIDSVTSQVGQAVSDRYDPDCCDILWEDYEYPCVPGEEEYDRERMCHGFHYYITCNCGSGGGSGTGGGSGGGSSGGNGGGGGSTSGGNNAEFFWAIFNGKLPVNLFDQYPQYLLPGFDKQIFQQFVAIHKVMQFNSAELDSLAKHPDYVPILHDAFFNQNLRDAALIKQILGFVLTNKLGAAQLQYLLSDPLFFEQIRQVTTQLSLSKTQILWLFSHTDVTGQFFQWINDFDFTASDVGLMQRVLQYKMTSNENDVNAARDFLAAELETILQEHGLSLPANKDAWTPEFWEIAWDVLKETVPELIPGLDTALDLKNAVESANNGEWWQSAGYFAGALISLTPWDKVKDSYKFAKAIKRADRWFDLIKRCAGYSDEMGKGIHHVLKKESKNPHIFRKAAGHVPDLNPVIEAAGGADELLFDVYKKIYDNNWALGLPIGPPEKVIDLVLHGHTLRAKIIRVLDSSTGIVRLEVSNLWKI